jgi:hypothetical protein
MASAQLGEHVEATAVGQIQVEEDEAEIGVLVRDPQGLP